MSTGFTSEFFAENRKRLRELFTGTAPIVLTANGLLQRGADMAYPFAQDASFWYLTGLDEPDVILVLDKDREYLIVPTQDPRRAAFEGTVDETQLMRRSGIELVVDETEGWKKLEARLEKVKHIATLPAAPAYIDSLGMYTNPARRRLIDRMKEINPGLDLLDISEHLTRLRMIKQPAELAAIRQAIHITGKGLQYTARQLKRDVYTAERELEADLTRIFRREGAQGHAFTPIVATGPNACTLHYEENDADLTAGELLVCDVGAQFDHYSADITRTFSVGEPTRRQIAVYAAVREVQQFAYTILKPGILMRDYEQQVEHVMGETLRELGLVKTIDRAAVRELYPHATSHFLGLMPHDSGLYDKPLEAGMVLTVEPGIYIASEGIGVRIEDDVLLTESGVEVLSAAIPQGLLGEKLVQ